MDTDPNRQALGAYPDPNRQALDADPDPQHYICRGDDSTVRNIIMARFYLCENPEWNVNKSASRLYV